MVFPLLCGDARHKKLTLIRREVRHGALDEFATLPRFDLREGYGDVHAVYVSAEGAFFLNDHNNILTYGVGPP